MSDKTYLYQINITRDCNLRCTHCYIHSDTKAASDEMTASEIVGIFTQIRDHMEKNIHNIAEIHIIGGEPTMLGLQYFVDNIPIARKILKSDLFSYKLMMVSNLLSDDILPIAKLFDNVCTSYEPETRFVSLKGNYKKALEEEWKRKVALLIENGIDLSATIAMTTRSLDHGAPKLLNYLYDMGIKKVHLGFFIPEGDGLDNSFEAGDELNNYIATDKTVNGALQRTADSLFPEFIDTSKFLIEATDWYVNKKSTDPDVHTNPIESMAISLRKKEPLDDIVCPIISGSIDINWDGNAATCLEAGGSKDPNYLGNVFKQNIADIVKSPKFKKEVLKAARPQTGCMSCEYYTMCRGGCSVIAKWWDHKTDSDCPGFKTYIKYIDNLVSEDVL